MYTLVLGVMGVLFFAINTVLWCTFFYPLALIKPLEKLKSINYIYKKISVKIAESWIYCNSIFLNLLNPIKFHIHLPDGLKKKASYLVVSNHQSWVDIIALQYAFNKKVPFFRFFIKDTLKWVPFLGVAWKLLDYPFMKRKKGSQDLKTAAEACRKLKGIPASILIFIEGTRFSLSKKIKLKSPYQFVLPPKIGGMASVLDSIGTQIDSLIDVTIIYPQKVNTSFWGLMSGQIKDVWVEVKEIKIPEKFKCHDITSNLELRKEFEIWVQQIWQAKDELLQSSEVFTQKC